MSIRYPFAALIALTGAVVVLAWVVAPRLLAEAPPRREGALAAGVAEDGTLLVRSVECGGEPTEVTVSWVTPGNPGSRSERRFGAARVVEVDLPAGLGARTTLRITAPRFDGLDLTPAQWTAVSPDTWLVASPPESHGTTTLATAELEDRLC
ncbi:hypothetical protein [Aeromicrobium duanguangcaii]|uniref:hypothetical protein n=1 Tax=Aeromicrobium duanguangcaii TaxID=2968086 RepID=UPI0020180165|nr:hypothetical protein [Aeromicrobium duanguangcaii]MCL3838125.1 hypothetical protein [Aeromicrobium duanguangcaii]